MAYAFCRISVRGSSGLDYQEAEILKVAEECKWEIKETIKYTGSAYKNIPEPLERLVKLKNKKILFYSVDRLSRNFDNGIDLAERFIEAGNELYFIVEKLRLVELRGPEWETFQKYLRYAEAESAKIAARSRDALKYIRSQGYFTGSTAPFGYNKQRLDNGRHVLVADPLAEHILQFIELCKTPGTTMKKINEVMALCGGDTKSHPIVLDEKTPTLETDLRWENIATLLNDYEIKGGPWSASKVSRIYKSNSVSKLASDFNLKIDLINHNARRGLDDDDDTDNSDDFQ